jgi:hypothetical protein
MTILCRLERPQEVLFRLVAELVAASAAISVLEIQYISAGRAGVELHRANRILIVPSLRSLEPGRNIPSSSDVSQLAALNLPCWVAVFADTVGGRQLRPRRRDEEGFCAL